ncbi:sugar-transfer associated ATP-grasp domain-containing protein [Arsukibacterium sp.]|uniref:sugar-transfer associated ATP-grasp domain-containing protein n=1 Tax=Arsukibacterium sp. TaxID=1977258 RepID=UPI00299E2252|nr:sugar-transfer associated ATP-grasp domain-containing protein [Arsukibacterium sp.]MDX1538465.1 sugar-transfer associated ATP-grasp domain-containing protein [Arsukibacterium sp.]
MLSTISKAIKMSRQRAKDENALSFSQQLKEMLLLQLKTGFGPGNYHKYLLWQKNMPWQQKLGYWHDQKYYRFLNKINPLNYRMLARNKVMAKAILKFYNIPDAEYLGYLSAAGGFKADGSPLNSAEQLATFLQQRPDLDRICFKPVDGSGGEGFCAVEIDRSNDILFRELGKSTTLPIADFLSQALKVDQGCDYIIEKYLQQHPTLAAFNPSSLNTLRVWVGKATNGTPKIIAIYLRVGRSGQLIDNKAAGGFGVSVDMDSFKTVMLLPPDNNDHCYASHPDSGENMIDRQLPFQQEVIALAERVISILPNTRFVGLDIALTPERPVIIEFNFAPTATGTTKMNASHQQLLGWLDGS